MEGRAVKTAAAWVAPLFACVFGAVLAADGRDRPMPRPRAIIPEALAERLHVGDWVLRQGANGDSRLIAYLSRSDVSHIGYVVSTSPQVTIIHATTDDDPERPDQVLLSTLHDFYRADQARSYLVLRPNFMDESQKERVAEWLLAKRGETFVLGTRTEGHLYCTTLLAEAIQSVNARFAPLWQRVDAPLFRGDYLFPQAFVEYGQSTVIGKTGAEW